MKKLLSLVLALLLLTASSLAEGVDYSAMSTDELFVQYSQIMAEILKRNQPADPADLTTQKEILFRGLPWGCSPQDFTGMTSPLGVSPNYKLAEMRSFEADFYWTGIVRADYFVDDGGFSCSPSVKNLNVAGFPVSSMSAYFHLGYDDENVYEDQEHASFYLASYKFSPVDYRSAYDMLTGKMNQLYGEGVVHQKTSGWSSSSGSSTKYTNWVVWQGANDTAAYLWYNYEQYDNGRIENEQLTLFYGRSNSVALLKGLQAAQAREELELAAADMSGL